MNDYQSLDALALRAGTDKASSCHNYMEVYARYFAPLRHRPIKFLEIGIYEGSSIKLWEDYFSSAELHFLDITFVHLKHHSPRAHLHLGNQQSREDLTRFIQESGGAFDVILDDGGHHSSQQLTSFEMLFPHLNAGGLYIIEDLHSSYWEGGATMNYLKRLIDEVNYVGARSGKAGRDHFPDSHRHELTLYRDQIRSLSFYTSLVILEKR